MGLSVILFGGEWGGVLSMGGVVGRGVCAVYVNRAGAMVFRMNKKRNKCRYLSHFFIFVRNCMIWKNIS